MEGFFALSCPPVKSARMRDLAARRIVKQFCDTQKNPRMDFFESYAAMEGPALAGCGTKWSNGGVGPPEPRNGGDEMKRSVELVKGRMVEQTKVSS